MPEGSQSFIGEIAMYGFTYTPRDYLACNGTLIAIAQNQALFALLGATFGGDGRVTFGLPNLNSRMPVGATLSGTAPGLDTYVQGQYDGVQQRTLSHAQMPEHTHSAVFTPSQPSPIDVTVDAYVSSSDKSVPELGDFLAGGSGTRFRSPGGFGEPAKVEIGGVNTTGGGLADGWVSLDDTGTGSAFLTLSPIQAVAFCICEYGDFPSRN